ncbi:MAG: tyrosine-type recombinase/integrase [Acidimicrobiales bacterium]
MSQPLGPVGDRQIQRTQVIEGWLRAYSSGASRRTMESALRSIAMHADDGPNGTRMDLTQFPWELLADQIFYEAVQTRILSSVEHATANRYISAMRSVAKRCAVAGLADPSTLAETLDNVRCTRRRGSPGRRFDLDTTGLLTVLWVCRQDFNPVIGARDMAIISLAASTGARRSAVVGLDLDDVSADLRSVHFRTVKGGGDHHSPLHHRSTEHLDAWLGFRGHTKGPLFTCLVKGGGVTQRRLSDHQFWKILRHRGDEAHLGYAPTPHDLRRWFVTSLLDGDVDLFTVARAVGHTSPVTTFQYDKRPAQRIKEAVDKLDLPSLESLDSDEDPRAWPV